MLHKAWRSVVWLQGSGVSRRKQSLQQIPPCLIRATRNVTHTHFVLQCVESSVTETEHWTNACSASTCACTKRYHQKLCWHEQLMCSETKSADRWQINLWFTAERFCCPTLRCFWYMPNIHYIITSHYFRVFIRLFSWQDEKKKTEKKAGVQLPIAVDMSSHDSWLPLGASLLFLPRFLAPLIIAVGCTSDLS